MTDEVEKLQALAKRQQRDREQFLAKIDQLEKELADAREELKKATGCICGEDHYPDGP